MTFIIAVNNRESTLLVISPHLGTYNNITILPSQISYCFEIMGLFGCYSTRHAMFAFKFPESSKDKSTTREKKRSMEYYKIVDKVKRYYGFPLIRCTSNGVTSVMQDGRWIKKNFPDYVMPFQNPWIR
jgi:hypothetical protein